MSLEITGKLIRKLDLQEGVGKTGNNWRKQEFIIETQEQYPRKICANFWGDKIDMLSKANIDDEVKISFDIESREFNGKWYTDIKAWKLEVAGGQMAAPAAPAAQQPAPATYMNAAPAPAEDAIGDNFTDDGSSNDLPF